MTDSHAVLVPHDNVNDESVRILSWLVANGQAVVKDQPLVELETSKTSVQIYAPVAGIVEYSAQEGDELAIGARLCAITVERLTNGKPLGEPQALEIDRFASPTASESSLTAAAQTELSMRPRVAAGSPTMTTNDHAVGDTPARFSKKAMELLREHHRSEKEFAGRGLVRVQDVRKLLGEALPPHAPSLGPSANPAASLATPVAAAGVPFRSEELPRAKRMEIKYLRSAVDHTLPSLVSVAVPTRGLRTAVTRHPQLCGNATALIVYEVARLLRQYPTFNAFYADGLAHYYEEVNIGFAIDVDRGLKVPVIRRADQKGLPAIAEEMRELLVQYLTDAISVQALAAGTFTITDLSGEGVLAFHPVLNQGQSAILGVGGEVFGLGPGSHGAYQLMLAFDHQLSAGRQAAQFLNQLRQRLGAYEAVLIGEDSHAAPRPEPACSDCLRPVSELRRLDAHLLQTVSHDHSPRPVCSLCLAGY
jgi:pyruvate/2-oxoglutarate dehydrogenase complex dihydrolipoamide acyltransferase (E2) component